MKKQVTSNLFLKTYFLRMYGQHACDLGIVPGEP